MGDYIDDGGDNYWADLEYEAAEQRAKAHDAAQEFYDQEAEKLGPAIEQAPFISISDRLTLSIWDVQLNKPDYYDWFLDTVEF